MAYSTHHFVAYLSNTHTGGQGNQALVDFDFLRPGEEALTIDDLTARIIGYFAGYIASTGATSTSLDRITYRPNDVAGTIDVAWPTAAYDALTGVFPGLQDLTHYGVITGTAEALTPIGTSICVREFTASPTRSGKGRHYLPFLAAASVTSAGILGPTPAANLVDNYNAMFLEGDAYGDTVPTADPCVVSIKDNLARLILDITPNTILSNLRTRRR